MLKGRATPIAAALEGARRADVVAAVRVLQYSTLCECAYARGRYTHTSFGSEPFFFPERQKQRRGGIARPLSSARLVTSDLLQTWCVRVHASLPSSWLASPRRARAATRRGADAAHPRRRASTAERRVCDATRARAGRRARAAPSRVLARRDPSLGRRGGGVVDVAVAEPASSRASPASSGAATARSQARALLFSFPAILSSFADVPPSVFAPALRCSLRTSTCSTPPRLWRRASTSSSASCSRRTRSSWT